MLKPRCPTPWCWGLRGHPCPPCPALRRHCCRRRNGLGHSTRSIQAGWKPHAWRLAAPAPHSHQKARQEALHRGRAGSGCSSRFIKATGNTASTFREVWFKPTCLARKTSSRDSFQKRGENNTDYITPSEKDRKRYRNKRPHVWLCAIPEVPTSFFFFLNCTLTIRKWSWIISG